MYNTFAYIVYLSLTLVVIVFVGLLIFRNGRFYLVELFRDEHIADAVNRFLYAGYCLLNAGGAFRCLVRVEEFTSYRQTFEYVVAGQGQLLLLLGLMHGINLAVLPLLKNFLRSKFHPGQPGDHSRPSNH
jgi:hypothetical protein